MVNKFVEFYGAGLDGLPLADRATIGNMAPEYGATCGFFPIDDETLRYLRVSGRDEARIALVEQYAKANGFWRGDGFEPVYTDTLALDMAEVEPSLAGPKRPQDRVALSAAAVEFRKVVDQHRDTVGYKSEVRWEGEGGAPEPRDVPGHHEGHNGAKDRWVRVEGSDYRIHDGSVVIAAITSCTNTSNPYVMVGAGLVARKARALGLTRKPWVKTSLAPGSQVVSHYLEASGLTEDLDALGFNLVGYGCTTCIGNSGPLPEDISKAVQEGDLVAASVLSGNRNFEGRINPDVRANYLASPPLVVAYAIAGDMNLDIAKEPIGTSKDGKPVYLKDIWPSQLEISEIVERTVTRESFRSKYADVFKGDALWQKVEVEMSETYSWPAGSTYVQNPPYFQGMAREAGVIHDIDRRAHPGAPGGFGHHRPHLAGGLVQGDASGRRLPAGAAGAGQRVQLLRLAARQPRGDDARHLRQHPHPERDARRGRGRLHPRAGRRARSRSTTPPWPGRRRACRWWWSRARSTAPARRATGRPRARRCSGSRR